VTRVIARSISHPLIEVKQGLTQLADGNPATRIGGTGRQDEIGEIATALEVLRNRLQQAKEQETEMLQGAQQRVVRALSVGLRNLSTGNLTQPIDEPFAEDYETLRLDFNNTLDTLTQTIAQVVEASESIRARSAEISHASEDLSARTESQAATLEETAAALDELTASMKSAAEGARHVVITDVNPARLALAAQVADVTTVNVATEDLREVMARLKMAQGFDVGLEMSSAQAALDQMVEALVMGGRIALLGIPPGKSPVDWSRIVFKAITIKGVYGRDIFETWYKMIAMLENGLDIRGVITHRLPVAEFEAGFAAMRGGQSGKVVLDWG
jgi:HAMP domain-containing protein